MEYTSLKIAEYLNGKLEGNSSLVVSNVAKIDEADKNSITFLSNKKYTSLVYKTKAALLVVDKDFKAESDIIPMLIRVDNAYIGFVKLLHLFNTTTEIKSGVSKLSEVSKTCLLYTSDAADE